MKKLHMLSCIAMLSVLPIIACGKNDAADKVAIKKTSVQSPYSMEQILEEQKKQANTDTTAPEGSTSAPDATNGNSSAISSSTDDISQNIEADLEKEETSADPSVDVDLTALSATMVYSEVYQMMYYPENYVGKSIKMDGLYDHYHDENSGNDYYSCIIQDATACCAQGIEFRLSDGNYPADTEDFVAVKGTFTTYEENGTTYCTLADAELVSPSQNTP